MAHLLSSVETKNELLISPKTIKDYFITLKPYENMIYLMKTPVCYIVRKQLFIKIE